MESLEQLGFVVWVRESGSIFGYATFLFLHTIGLSALAGVSAAIDLRLLGFAPRIPVSVLSRLFPLMWTALGVTAVSGTVILLTDLSNKLSAPVFAVKMLCVLLAVVALWLLKTRVFSDPEIDARPPSVSARRLAAASLFLWLAATTAGRLMAYLSPSGSGSF